VDDRERWEPLWHGYLDIYRAVLTPELVLHPTTWATHPSCYLEDLYVAKPWPGGDVAQRLIQAVYAFADGFGPASVYWLTQEYNAPARSLYDTLAHRTSFVVYRR
jgi:GNAT superfamily N-acetyltransferase